MIYENLKGFGEILFGKNKQTNKQTTTTTKQKQKQNKQQKQTATLKLKRILKESLKVFTTSQQFRSN